MIIYKIKYNILLFILTAFAYLPLNMLYIISDVLAFFTHKIIKYRIAVVRENLSNSFPEKTIKELKEIENKFYRHLCDVIVETIKLLKISDNALAQRIKVVNPELPKSIFKESNIIILFLGHYANWEWIPFLSSCFDKEIEMGSLYKTLHSKLMDGIMKKIRSRHRIELIESKSAYRILFEKKQKQQKFMVGFIGDQRPLNPKQKYNLSFLNQPTPTLVGAETIGKKIESTFLFLDIESNKRGYYNLTFKKMIITNEEFKTESYPYTKLFYYYLENNIKRNPHLWLWSHNRWKHQKS